MLNSIIRLALTHRGIVLVACLVALVYGGYLSTTLPIDVFPDLDRPRVVVLTECPGLSAEEIESLVTQPIETALLGASGVEAVRSQSGNGMNVIYVEFGWKTEVRYARQVVAERMATVTLPPGIKPQMTPPASIMGQIMNVGLAWKTDAPSRAGKLDLQNRMDLRTIADWLVRPRLLRLPGIAEVIVLGGDRKQYQVLVDPERLQEYNVSLQEVEAAIKANNLNASGGFIEEGQTERPVRVIGRLGPLSEQVVADLPKVVVKENPVRAVLLGNVATVEEGPAPKRGDASIDGRPGVVLTIVKQPHADTRKLTDEVKAALRDITLPADMVVNTELFNLKSFIDRGVYYVEEALVIGAVLVVIVLFLFLLNIRTTFITLTAIPLSLVVTTLVFRLIGWLTGQELSINVMTLGGIAVAMGELVDDAIVDVENIHRRLGENAARPDPHPAIVVVYQASREIRSAIVFGTAVVILAFMPLFALSGVEGRLFVPLGIAYIVSILASLVVSLTVTPVLSYYLLKRSHHSHAHGDGVLLRGLKWAAGFLIRFSMRRAGLLLLLTWIVVAFCGWRLSTLGADFLPKFDEGSVQVNVGLPGGSSLKASNEASVLIDARLRTMQKTPENPNGPVLHFARRTGRAELDEHAEPVNVGEYILTMNPDAGVRRDEFLKSLLADLRAAAPGVEIETEQPLSHLISHMLSGVRSQIAIVIYGDDLDKLRELARMVRDVVASVPGVTPPIIDPQQRVDEVHVVLRPDDLAFHQISREYVAAFVQTALKGEAVSVVLEGQRRFDLVVKLREPYRSDAYKLGELRLDLPNGRGQIRLREVADFPATASGTNLINRENVRRKQVVRCNVAGRDLESAVAEIERKVRGKVMMPEGYFVEFGGQFAAQRSATRLIAVLALVSLTGIFLVLLMLYPSVRVTLQILNAIPTAFIGGVLALVITQQTLTVASLVGFVSLGGIAVRNGILLVTHYFHLMKEEGQPFSQETVLRGSLERLAPVLMTALTAGIGLLPLVMGGRKPGLEILYPVATVILGGLMTSTFCEFLVHPGLFWKFSGKDAASMVRTEGSDVELLRTRAVRLVGVESNVSFERMNAMKTRYLLGLGLLIAAAAVIGCSDKKPDAPKVEDKKGGGKAEEHAAHGAGPNGGVVFDLGKHHAEFTVDHDKKECTVLILNGDHKGATEMAVVAKELTVATKATKTKEGKAVPPMTITLRTTNTKDGKASKFVGTDPGLGNVADFEGTVIGEIDGKPSQGEFKEEDHDGKKAMGPMDEHGRAVVAAPAGQEAEVYLTAAGIYTAADIKANGNTTVSAKYKDLKVAHDLKPKAGDKICPITLTKANPKLTWVIGGKTYEFCCPPCVEEFVTLAKTKPEEVKAPDAYIKK